MNAQKIAESARLSDACLALRGTYVRDLPRHARVLAKLDGDLEAMIARLAQWAEMDRSTEEFFQIEEEESGSVADQFDDAFLNETTKYR